MTVQHALIVRVNRVVLTLPNGCEQFDDFAVAELVGGVVKTRYFRCVEFKALFVLGSWIPHLVSSLAKVGYEAYLLL